MFFVPAYLHLLRPTSVATYYSQVDILPYEFRAAVHPVVSFHILHLLSVCLRLEGPLWAKSVESYVWTVMHARCELCEGES